MSIRTSRPPVRRWCQELEDRLLAGEPARAEEYLARGPLPPEDAVELVYAEFVAREDLGPAPDPAEYYARFPALRGPLEDQFLVHDAMRADPGPAAPASGQSVGPYELGRELGRGGRGAVFAARDRRDGKAVALKLLLSGEYSTPDDLALFQHEAAVLGRLDHPNLVRILDAGAADGRPYLALECVDGPTLAGRIAEFRSPAAAAGLVETLARAVHHAHLQGVVHRDLKPGNVLLSPAGEPKVSDFGLAKRLDAATGQTRTGDIIGTLGYMAPEQAAGTAHRAGPPADVYALGAVLYELLTGRPPFGPDPSARTLYDLLHEPPVPPRRLVGAVPRDLETVCLHCLEKNPDRRYPSALALAEDLRRYLDGKPVTARPVGSAARLGRWAARRPTAAALLGVLAFVAVAAVVGAGYHTTRLTAANDGLRAANDDLQAALKTGADLRAETVRQNEQLAVRLDDARRAMYALQLGQLPSLWLREPIRARGLLADARVCPPELRDFTWGYFNRLCRMDERSFAAHEGEAWAVAFLPDGRVVSAGADGRLRYADPDAKSGPSVPAHPKGVCGVAVLPGGGGVVSCGPDGIKVWPAGGAEPKRAVRSPSPVLAVAADPTGGPVAGACEDGTVRLWNPATGELVVELVGHAGAVRAVAFAPDGKTLVSSGADRLVRVWDVPYRQQAAAWPGHAGPVLGVAVTADGKAVVSAGEAADAFLWDAKTGTPRPLRGHLFPVWGAAAAPRGGLVATAGDDTYLKLWDAATGQELTNLMRTNLRCAAFAPDGERVAVGDRGGKVWVYAVPSDTPPIRYALPANAAAVLPRPGGGAVTADASGTVRAWDAAGGVTAEFVTATGITPAVALSPDGKLVAAADGNDVVLWDIDRRAEVGRMRGHEGAVAAVAFRPDGSRVASGGADKSVRVWDVAGGRSLAALAGHTSGVLALAYSPDGQTLASAGGYSPGPRVLPNVGDEFAVRLWDGDTGAAVGRPLRGHGQWVLALAFSPDGKTLASGGRDRTARLWDVTAPGKPHAVLSGYTNWVSGVAFSPDGKTLATASGHPSINTPGEVKLCDPKSGYVRAILREAKAPVAFAPDGKALLAGTRGGAAELTAD
jgi:WD40 repeat protein